MAIIREYQAPVDSFHPVDTGPESEQRAARSIHYDLQSAGERVGGAIAKVGGQIGNRIDQYRGRQESLALGASGASLTANLSQQYNADLKTALASGKPLDPNFSSNWIKTHVAPAFQAWSQQANTPIGQEFATRYSLAATQHFYTMAAADESHVAATNAATSLATISRSFSQMVAQDPTGLNHALDQVDAVVKQYTSQNSALSAEDVAQIGGLADKIKEAVTHAAVYGAIERNPSQALSDLEAGKFGPYASGGQLLAAASTAKRMAKSDATQARIAHDLEVREHSANLASGLLSTFTTDQNGNLKPPPDLGARAIQALKDGMTPAALGQVMGFAHASASFADKIDKSGDPTVYTALGNGVFNGSTQPEDVYKGVLAGKLTPPQGRELLDALRTVAPEMTQDPVLAQTWRQLQSTMKLGLKASPQVGMPVNAQNAAAYASWYSTTISTLLKLPSADARRAYVLQELSKDNVNAAIKQYGGDTGLDPFAGSPSPGGQKAATPGAAPPELTTILNQGLTQ